MQPAPYPQLFSSYEAALQSCMAGGYQNPDLVSAVVEKNRILQAQKKSMIEFDLGSMRAVLAIGLAKQKNKITVLDFGGGGGFHWNVARIAFGDTLHLDWRVIETPAMVEVAKKSINQEGLRFYDSIGASHTPTEAIDLVLTSSSLQYCSSPLEVLKELMQVQARTMFITRTPFYNGSRALFTTQRSFLSENGPGLLPPGYVDVLVEYPVTYFPKAQIESQILTEYSFRFALNEEAGNLFFDGLPANNYYGYFCDKLIS